MADSLNQRIGDYEILGVLGAGGMGKVYRVRNVISDRIEAMKILLPSLSDHKEVGERFLREIKLVASLHHPNIATLCTAQNLENHLVMVMEFVDGTTFSDLLDRHELSLGTALQYFDQALAALGYAHSKGIVHRDIKPSNIMLTPNGVVKLMDFGIARADADRALTQTGATIGTVNYMSPEQIAGKPIDGRSDLYSMGIFLYETITGEQPFKGSSDYEIMAAHINTAPRPPVDFVPNVPQALNAIVLRLLAKNPIDRYQTAEEVREAIRHVPIQSGALLPQAQSARPASARSATVVEGVTAPTTLMTTLMQSQGTGTMVHDAHSGRKATEVSGMQTYNPPPVSLAVRRKSLMQQPLVYVGGVAAVGVCAAAVVFFSHKDEKKEAAPPAPVVTQQTSSGGQTTGKGGQGAPPGSHGTTPPVGGATDPSRTAVLGATRRPELAGLARGQSAAPTLPNAGAGAAQGVPQRSSGAPGVAAGGQVQAQAPAISPELKAKLDQQETEIDQLDARASSINGSLETMKASMRKDGLSMRGDIATKQASMNTSIAKAKQALAAHDPDRSARFSAQAQSEAGELESFLGR